MAKIAFDVKYRQQIETGEYKVETRDGKSVRIICWDAKSTYPILALVLYKNNCEIAISYTENGQYDVDVDFNSEDLSIIIPDLVESEDERIRKTLCDIVLEMPYMETELRAHGLTVKETLTYLEKQEERNKAIAALEKIDKYIDEHTANAHDMKDSNPDKKYYSGVDATLSDIAGILIEVYSEGKQKSNVEKLREISTPADEDWFEISKKWEKEDNEDLHPFISVKFASNAKVINGKRFAVLTWERFKDIALDFINRGK